jgi:hypothetical protein
LNQKAVRAGRAGLEVISWVATDHSTAIGQRENRILDRLAQWIVYSGSARTRFAFERFLCDFEDWDAEEFDFHTSWLLFVFIFVHSAQSHRLIQSATQVTYSD